MSLGILAGKVSMVCRRCAVATSRPARSGRGEGGVLTRPLLFHHARLLEHVRYGLVRQAKLTDERPPCQNGACDWDDDWHFALHMETCYAWLAERVGFWPLFLGVGSHYWDLHLTGYQDQWRRFLGHGPDGRAYRHAGEFPNKVLLSYDDAPPGIVFSDFHTWHIVLNSVDWTAKPGHDLRMRPPGISADRLVLKPSWSKADWLRKARRQPGSVQAVVPALDLTAATAVWCRNQVTKRKLVDLGFSPERVAVRRLCVGD